MIQEVFNNSILIYVMTGLCCLGIVVKLIIHIIYKNLIIASDNMANSNNKLMKLVKMKFEACYKLKIGVNNVDIFVDKYIYKYKFCGILLYTWENISGQVLILCLLTGAVGAGLGVFYEFGETEILSTFFIGLFTSALLIVFESFLNLPAKRNVIRINMKDYLENMFKVRLEQEYFYPEKLESYRNEYFNSSKELKDVNEQANNREDMLTKNIANTKEKADSVIDIAATKELSSENRKERMTKKNLSNSTSLKKEKNRKSSKNDPKVYEINKNEEQVIKDILKEFMG